MSTSYFTRGVFNGRNAVIEQHCFGEDIYICGTLFTDNVPTIIKRIQVDDDVKIENVSNTAIKINLPCQSIIDNTMPKIYDLIKYFKMCIDEEKNINEGYKKINADIVRILRRNGVEKIENVKR